MNSADLARTEVCSFKIVINARLYVGRVTHYLLSFVQEGERKVDGSALMMTRSGTDHKGKLFLSNRQHIEAVPLPYLWVLGRAVEDVLIIMSSRRGRGSLRGTREIFLLRTLPDTDG